MDQGARPVQRTRGAALPVCRQGPPLGNLSGRLLQDLDHFPGGPGRVPLGSVSRFVPFLVVDLVRIPAGPFRGILLLGHFYPVMERDLTDHPLQPLRPLRPGRPGETGHTRSFLHAAGLCRRTCGDRLWAICPAGAPGPALDSSFTRYGGQWLSSV